MGIFLFFNPLPAAECTDGHRAEQTLILPD
jgi:hypothetical protein